VTISCFWGSHDRDGYEKWESKFEVFSSYFILISKQKYRYTQMSLVGKAYWLWINSHSSCRCWFVLQGLLCTRCTLHLFFTEFRETLEGIRKIIKGMVAKFDIDSEPPVLIEPDIVDIVYEPNSKVVEYSEPEAEVEELLIETLVDLSVESIMELVSSLSVMRASLFLRSHDVYDPLQIFLHETRSVYS